MFRSKHLKHIAGEDVSKREVLLIQHKKIQYRKLHHRKYSSKISHHQESNKKKRLQNFCNDGNWHPCPPSQRKWPSYAYQGCKFRADWPWDSWRQWRNGKSRPRLTKSKQTYRKILKHHHSIGGLHEARAFIPPFSWWKHHNGADEFIIAVY